MKLNKRVAWHSTQALLIVVGGTGTIAFAATLPWWLDVTGFCVLSLTWFLIYRFECILLERFGGTWAGKEII